ncbi:hypothetical protein JOM56_015203 [Amanita muscaria]
MSVDTHMQSQQSGMKVVDPSRPCSYVTGFSQRVSGGEQAQHLKEAMVVVERMPTPLPDFHVDQGLTLLGELRRRLVQDTVPMTVEQLEQLRATCLGCVWRHREERNRDVLLRESCCNLWRCLRRPCMKNDSRLCSSCFFTLFYGLSLLET